MTVYLIPVDQELGTCAHCDGVGPIEDLYRTESGLLCPYCNKLDMREAERREEAKWELADRYYHEDREDQL